MAVASRPPTVLNGGLQTTVTLAPSVIRVQSGTPLAPSPEGWVASTTPVLFAAAGSFGGETITAYRGVSLEIHDALLTAGTRYLIEDVDENGGVSYAAGDGPGVATAPSRIILEAGALVPPTAPLSSSRSTPTPSRETSSRETGPTPTPSR